jgi:hypothetical protein
MLQLGLVLLAGAVLIDVAAEHWRHARERGLADREAEREHRALLRELRRHPRDGC